MFNTKTIEKIAKYMHEYFPQYIQNITCDLDSKILKILQNQLNNINFVNRNELDEYTQILFETQKKLAQLEIKIKKLESIYKNKFNKNKN
ncbi:DUF526; may be involved in protein biosynthesis [Candidatus Blochmanniella floridana]|uniref:DUF526 may be involved in protein biosynthesis n=1 Tax=Blochmanniella floridana TaxID=203907 RepID=Q7VQQ5_BLOFL|nr:DUF526; may be involved in protein biosynthesis [Candidatus Blochmannia floridanus]